jgi:molybdopterin molybdotransferase
VSAGTPRSGHLDLCYQDDPELLPAAEAMRRIHAHVPLIEDREQVALDDALERILGEDVIAPRDVPGHTNSAVDGYALAGAVLPREGEASVRIAGTALAGAPHAGAVGAGECVRIMTGAVMPEGTDTVVMQEHVSVTGKQVRIAAGHRAGQNVRRAGEDLRAGQVMLAAGTRLLPAALGMLASVGIAQVCVRRRVKVAFFSTGDELRSLGEALAPGQVYDSNRYTLRGMLTRLGVDFVDLGVVRDDPVLLREAIDAACAAADVVLTSGGVSTGEADYVKGILEQRGQVGFWRIAVRPGRPLAFGRLGEAVFFGLPGNPVAVMMTFYQFVQPALLAMQGQRAPPPVPLLDAQCPEALRKKPGRVEYYRAVLTRDADGVLRVRPTGRTGSGLLHTMNDANCLIVLPEQSGSLEAGSIVPVQPFFGLV